VTTFVALQDVDLSMGPTMIYSGTHTPTFHGLVDDARREVM
jgi:hypothetical protein